MTRQISRRAFIGGAAGATALAAGGVTFAALLAREEEASPAAPFAPPTEQPTPTATLPPPPPGGRQVITAPGILAADTFDAQLTGKSSVVEILGRTHSRLVQWDDETPRNLVADLGAKWEQPDATTTLFHIDPAAKWHNRPPINGRPVTAEDVVAHFKRSLQLSAAGKAPIAQRYDRYSTLESVDSPEPGTVRFRTKAADAYFLDLLASEFALIQAPEAVRDFSAVWSKADSDHVIGSGPWTFDWDDRGAKFTAWRHGHREPGLDELLVSEPRNVVDRFLAGELDEALTADRRAAAELRAGGTESVEFIRFQREIVMSSFFIGAPPWNNQELVAAISYALARDRIIDGLFGRRADEVRGVPGSLFGREAFHTAFGWPGGGDSGGTYSGARQKWQAAGGPGLGAVTIDFPSTFDPLYSASSIICDQLNAVLGPQFRPAVETYTTISKRIAERYYGNGRAAFWFGWGPPFASPRPETYFNELYAPGSPGQAAVGGPGIPNFENSYFDLARIGFLGIIPWVHQFQEVFRRPNRQGPHPSPFWTQHLDQQRRNA